MSTVITSIGGGTSHSESVAIDSVSGSGPYTVTLTATVPSSVVVGDAFFDEAATPNKYLITGISGSDLTVADSTGVGSAPDDTSGSSTPEITRYYNGSTPLADFEADFGDSDLYPGGASDDVQGECYNDGDLDSNSFNTGGMNSFLLTVDADDRHDGTAGTGARIFGGGLGLQCPSGLNQAYTAEWLEINGNDTATNMLSFISSSFTNVATARHIIAHGSSDNEGLVRATSRDSLVHNCILYQCERAGSSHWGCRIDADRSEGGFLNNTVAKCINNQTGTPLNYALQQSTDSSNSRIRNNIVAGAESPNASDLSNTLDIDYAGASGTISNNLSSDDTADDQGSNNVINIDPNDLFVSTTDGAEDYHLDADASDAIDAGVDLGTTPSGVEIDIDGRDRDAEADTWDIGADEFVAAVTDTFTATAALTRGGAQFAASSMAAPPDFTSEAALTRGGAQLSAEATFTPPTFTATAALTRGAATSAASATFTAPVYTSTAALIRGGSELAASAEVTNPNYTASVALTRGASEFAASATFAVSTFTATALLSRGGSSFSASVSFTAPVYTAAVSLTRGASTFSGTASFASAVFLASAALTRAGSELTAVAVFSPPVFTAAAAFVAPARVFNAIAFGDAILVCDITLTISLSTPVELSIRESTDVEFTIAEHS